MSTTMTPRSGVLSHAETRTDRQPDICKKLARKVAVITGGSTGMGLATAKTFVQEGADHVFITGRRKDVLDVAVAEIGDKATGIAGDVASLNDIDRVYDSVKRYGRKLDVVFANAGIAHASPLERRRLDHPERINRHCEGFPWNQRLQRHQSSRPVVRTHLDQRTPRTPYSRECSQPRPYRYSDFPKLAAGRMSSRR